MTTPKKDERYDLLHKEYLTLTTRVEKLEFIVAKLMKNPEQNGKDIRVEKKDEYVNEDDEQKTYVSQQVEDNNKLVQQMKKKNSRLKNS